MTIVASINCQGLRSADRRQTAFSFFTRSRFDIIFLQETHWTADMEIELQRDWQGHVSCTHGTNSARGAAILISSRLDYKVKETKRDNEGRVLNLVIEMDEQTINLVNVYAPNTDTERRTFFLNLEPFISKEYENIIGGDFNSIMDNRLDKLGGDPNSRQAATYFLRTFN